MNRKKNMNLGRLRINYTRDDDVIQIYNSAEVCSLVINNKIADRYTGVIATRFTLQGTIERGDKLVRIVAKMGFFYMRPYYDGALVCKKFMGFG